MSEYSIALEKMLEAGRVIDDGGREMTARFVSADEGPADRPLKPPTANIFTVVR